MNMEQSTNDSYKYFHLNDKTPQEMKQEGLREKAAELADAMFLSSGEGRIFIEAFLTGHEYALNTIRKAAAHPSTIHQEEMKKPARFEEGVSGDEFSDHGPKELIEHVDKQLASVQQEGQEWKQEAYSAIAKLQSHLQSLKEENERLRGDVQDLKEEVNALNRNPI